MAAMPPSLLGADPDLELRPDAHPEAAAHRIVQVEPSAQARRGILHGGGNYRQVDRVAVEQIVDAEGQSVGALPIQPDDTGQAERRETLDRIVVDIDAADGADIR